MTPSRQFLSGVVEGFYGRPWTASQRTELFAWMRAWGLNTYLYAPKDDLKHRHLWRACYSEHEASELGALIRACRAAGITFVYALAPGLDPDFASPAGIAALEEKAGQLLRLGCTCFAALFDDIVASPASGLLDTGAAVVGPQVAFAHHLLGLQRHRDPAAELLFCPTPYCGRMAGPPTESTYLRQLGAALDPVIQVLWTGPEIISERIHPEDVAEVAAVLRRKPLIWDNLFANDYDLRRLYLGPYSGRPAALRDTVAGVLCNPNCEFAANFVPLRTFAAWATSPDYEATIAARAAWREWQPRWQIAGSFPGDSSLIPLTALELVGDCFHLPHLQGPRSSAWLEDFAWLCQTAPALWDGRLDRFVATGREVIDVFEKLTLLHDRELLHTFYRHLWELKEEAALLLGYVEWLRTGKPGGSYSSAEHRAGTFCGGLAAEFQRLLPMDRSGRFHHPTGASP
ncbi:MAG: beta-N-acetylglucosaminidase domain-containing protein [Verrucomicrobia bacterium]|nr:beta-N-acetylglucosaminidase domain-containing protein [Verrucomicrobiota bacterium]